MNLYQQPPNLAPTSHNDVTVTLIIAGSTSVRTLKRTYQNLKKMGETPAEPVRPSTTPGPAPAE